MKNKLTNHKTEEEQMNRMLQLTEQRLKDEQVLSEKLANQVRYNSLLVLQENTVFVYSDPSTVE